MAAQHGKPGDVKAIGGSSVWLAVAKSADRKTAIVSKQVTETPFTLLQDTVPSA